MRFILFLPLLSYAALANAQSPLASLDVRFDVAYGPDSVYVDTPEFTGMAEKETHSGTLVITLSSTDNIQEVIVGAGTVSSGTNVASATFSFANTQESNGTMEYARNGNEIRVYLGEFIEKPNGYAWVKLRMNNNSLTAPLEQAIN